MATEATLGRIRVRLMVGDITRVPVDAIVNTANESLLGGGGVDGAIHRAGGPAILEECRRLGGCQPGEAKTTTAGKLPARWVVHTVGPRYYQDPASAPPILASAYRSALAEAERHGAASVSFPSISTGAFGYPVADAASVALSTVKSFGEAPPPRESSLQEVVFVLFDQRTHDAYAAALDELASQGG